MHRLVRMGLAALGLAVSAPTVGWAQQATPSSPPSASSVPTHKHPRNLFGKEILCTECLRARAMARSGKYIPPAPPLPPRVNGQTAEFRCANCGPEGAAVAGALMPGPVVAGGPVAVASKTKMKSAPGRAVVGDEAPGYAAVGGEVMLASEPTPISRATLTQAGASARRPAPNQPPSAPVDSGLMPTSFNPVPPQAGNRPHVLQHLFGLDAIGSLSRREQERRAREKHASIAYDQKVPKVTELPASMVYSPQR
jgi:hypothetical protein